MVKGKIILVHAMKAYGGSRVVTPHILNLGDKWRWAVKITAGKEPGTH
jgi:hypothetical protein